MKKFIGMVCLVTLVAASVMGQKAEKPYTWFVNGSLLSFTEPEFFTDIYGVGFGLGGGIEYPVNPSWSMIGSFSYSTFGASQSNAKEYVLDWLGMMPSDVVNYSSSGGRGYAWSFSVLSKGFLRNENQKLTPYFKGGFGLTNVSVDDLKYEFDIRGTNQHREDDFGVDSETNLSITIGFGAELPTGTAGSRLFFDIGYHLVTVDPDNVGVIPITFGYIF